MNPICETEKRRRHVIMANWLFVVIAMVFAMVILGGVTRLTHSGLSMVEWRPVTGWLPPLSEAAWMEVFELKFDPEISTKNRKSAVERKLKSLRKRFRNAKFAANVERDLIERCAGTGIELEAFLALALEALQEEPVLEV